MNILDAELSKIYKQNIKLNRTNNSSDTIEITLKKSYEDTIHQIADMLSNISTIYKKELDDFMKS